MAEELKPAVETEQKKSKKLMIMLAIKSEKAVKQYQLLKCSVD